ncbi:MAG: arginase family protein [Chloroflexota bacterium]|nr:arginase family protein [Chloroflexota bacterium]
MQLRVVTVPYRYDEWKDGLGAGPDAVLKAGLIERLQAVGVAVDGPREADLGAENRERGRTALNIGRIGARTAALVAEARTSGQAVLVLAGDDTAAIGVLSGIERADGAGARVGIVWLDAHGDFNTPETSYSGILAGMPLAILAGLAGPLWREAAGLAATVPTDRMLVAGVRDLDEKEAELLRSTDVRVVTADELRSGDPFATAVARLAERCDLLMLHIDADVLDPRLVPSASTPSANGLTIAEAAAAIAMVLSTGQVATVCLSSINPGAGARGERSVASAVELLETALREWQVIPPPREGQPPA